jgi:hypothetical protein
MNLKNLKRTKEYMLDMFEKYQYPTRIAKAMGITRERARQLLKLYRIPYKKMPWKETDRGIVLTKQKRLKTREKIKAQRQKLAQQKKQKQIRDSLICGLYRKSLYTQRELGRKFNLEQAYINIILRNNGLLYRDRNKWRNK